MTDTLSALQRLRDLAAAPRRNPQARRPHRQGGPAPPPDPKALLALERAAQLETIAAAKAAKAEAKRIEDEAKADFRRRRGCPPGTAQVYIDLMRKQGAWWGDEQT